MAGFQDFVTVVNRTSEERSATWDGKHVTLKPGDNFLPKIIGLAAKEQNAILGTEDPMTLTSEYFVGIKEHQDDCSKISDKDLKHLKTHSVERLDRTKLMGKSFDGREVEVVRGNTGIIPNQRVSSATMENRGGPVDSGFSDASKL